MRGLMTAVIGMGILIAVGTTVLVVLLVQRMSAAPTPIASAVVTAPAIRGTDAVGADGAGAVLDEPTGTRIAGVSLAGERVAVQLAGGGPDRVVIVDTRSGRIVARTALAH